MEMVHLITRSLAHCKGIIMKISIPHIKLALAVGFTIAVIGLPGAVQAAEITPDPSSYSYGSTSEVAPSTQVQLSNSGSLASTGENATYILIGAVVLIGGGIACLRFVAGKKR